MKEIIYAEGLKAPAAMPEGLQYDSAPFQSAYSMMYEQAKQVMRRRWYAKDLSGLPKAYVEPQEHDCLRADGIAYASSLMSRSYRNCWPKELRY